MAAKILALLAIASVLTQGQALTEISLPDQHHTFITNPFIGKAISIPKSFLDTLESCHVIFPNGVSFETYPNNFLPDGPITYQPAVQPFTSCGVGFTGAPVSASGIYELLSLVRHSADGSLSLTRQRFHMTFIESDSWQIPQ